MKELVSFSEKKMISILLIIAPCFFIGRQFMELAHEHNRSRYGFAALAIGVYIVSFFLFLFLGGVVAAQVIEVEPGETMSTFEDKLQKAGWAIQLSGVVLGSLSVVMFYLLLRSSWRRAGKRLSDSDSLDQL